MASFGSELLTVALSGTPTGEHPLRHVAELPARSGRPVEWPEWAEPDVVRAFTDRGIVSPVVAPVRGRRLGPRRPSRGGEHRHRVGQVAGLPTSRPQRAGDGPRGPECCTCRRPRRSATTSCAPRTL